MLTGSSRAIGGELTGNDTVKKFSFTGSTEVGRLLLAQCAGTVKKVSMELGGNAPFIVFDDADLDAAVTGALISKFRNAGQTCVCANRLYVQAGIHDRFVEKFTAALAELKVGNGLDAGVTFGPLIDENAIAKVQEHIADAVEKGGKVVVGGKPHALGGLFFEPTIVSHVTQQARVAREETFGPLAPIFRFETEEEVVRWPMTPNSAWPPTSTPATWAAASAWLRRWTTAWWPSTPASCPTRPRPSVASSSPAWAVRVPNTASRTMWK